MHYTIIKKHSRKDLQAESYQCNHKNDDTVSEECSRGHGQTGDKICKKRQRRTDLKQEKWDICGELFLRKRWKKKSQCLVFDGNPVAERVCDLRHNEPSVMPTGKELSARLDKNLSEDLRETGKQVSMSIIWTSNNTI